MIIRTSEHAPLKHEPPQDQHPPSSSKGTFTTDVATDVVISPSGSHLDELYRKASQILSDHQLPRYLPLDRHLAIVESTVQSLAEQEPLSQATVKEIQTILIQEHVLTIQSRAPDPFAASGNVFDFLTASDRERLGEAYDYALANGHNTEDVGQAGFFLAVQRNREKMIERGTIWKHHEPTDRAGTFVPRHTRGVGTSPHAQTSSKIEEPNGVIREQLKKGTLFVGNPFLRHSLFLNAVRTVLNEPLSSG
ncbi:hypothetical protein [Nitrospira sp. M1]